MPSAAAEVRIAVAEVTELTPGQRKIVEIDGRSIGIFNVNGTYIAILNVCPHALAPVCQGRIGGTTLTSLPGEYIWSREGEIIACPWHGWEFDLLTGDCLTDPRRLKRFPVEVKDNQLYLRLRLRSLA